MNIMFFYKLPAIGLNNNEKTRNLTYKVIKIANNHRNLNKY